jgi:hypothetical protein
MPDRACECLRSGPLSEARAVSYLGLDHTGGRFAEVDIEECTYCRRKWLHYEIHFDDALNPVRWFRGLINAGQAERVTPETTVAILEGLEWYLLGGESTGPESRRSRGPLNLEP